MPAGTSRTLRLTLLIWCLSILSSAGIFAQEEPEVDEAGAAAVDVHALAEQAIVLGEGGAGIGAVPPIASPLSVIQVVLTLVMVAVAIYGLVFILKKASRAGGGRMAQDPFLKVLASAPVGTNRAVHVVSLGSQAWLIGVAEHGVSLISEIADKETLDVMLLEDSRKSAESPVGRLPDFKSMLRRFGMPADSASPSPEDIRKRSERIKGM